MKKVRVIEYCSLLFLGIIRCCFAMENSFNNDSIVTLKANSPVLHLAVGNNAILTGLASNSMQYWNTDTHFIDRSSILFPGVGSGGVAVLDKTFFGASFFAYNNNDYKVGLFDQESNQEIKTFYNHKPITSLQVTQDYLCTGRADGTLRVFCSHKESKDHLYSGHSPNSLIIDVALCASKVAFITSDNIFYLCDLEARKNISWKKTEKPLKSLFLDNNRCYIGRDDGSVVLFDTNTKKGSLLVKGYTQEIMSLAIYKTFFMIAGLGDGTISLSDIRQPSCSLKNFKAHNRSISSLKLEMSQNWLVSASLDKKVIIWKDILNTIANK